VNSEGVPAGLVSVIRNSNAQDNPSAEGDISDGHAGGAFQLLEAKLELSKSSVSDEPEHIREVVRLLIHLVQGQRSELQARIAHNLAITVQPLIGHLQSLDLTEAQRRLVETLDFNIKHIASYFGTTVSDNDARLSPREIQICQMIRSGQNSREIAQRLGVTYQTVIVHRKNIRKKLGLNRNKGNLASYIRERMRADYGGGLTRSKYV
jgi:DNA-binding CsgD family transcriptional regulator